MIPQPFTPGFASEVRMNVQAAIRPQQMARETFEVFVISSGALTGIGKLLPLEDADDFDHALQIGTLCTPHKEKFCVRVTNALTGASLLKLYSVKRKSTPAYRHHDHVTRAIHDTYAEHFCDLDGAAFA